MSAATEFAPAVVIPARARRSSASALDWGVDPGAEREAGWGVGWAGEPGCAPAPGLASVTTLHAPRVAETSTAPLRLTRRGVAVVSVALAALAGALLWLAARSAPAPSAGAPHPQVVTVQAGDTLWSIATQVAPQRDPRAEVEALQHANHLTAAELAPGQTLRVP